MRFPYRSLRFILYFIFIFIVLFVLLSLFLPSSFLYSNEENSKQFSNFKNNNLKSNKLLFTKNENKIQSEVKQNFIPEKILSNSTQVKPIQHISNNEKSIILNDENKINHSQPPKQFSSQIEPSSPSPSPSPSSNFLLNFYVPLNNSVEYFPPLESYSPFCDKYYNFYKNFNNFISFDEPKWANAVSPWDFSLLLKSLKKHSNEEKQILNEELNKNSSKTNPPNNRVIELILYFSDLIKREGLSKQGNTMGEIVYWRSAVVAAGAANSFNKIYQNYNNNNLYNINVFWDENDLFQFISSNCIDCYYSESRLIVLIDSYSIQSIQKVFGDSLYNKVKYSVLLLDDWGTPPNQNGLQIDLNQYLVPWNYQNNQNFILGHFLSINTNSSKNFYKSLNMNNHNKNNMKLSSHPYSLKQRQAVVWGKEPSYFRSPGVIETIKFLSKWLNLQFIITAKDEVNSLINGIDNVKNLGRVSEEERDEILSKSLFILGLGDPILGLTPFQAMKFGTFYLNPSYGSPKKFWMNSVHSHSSQHFSLDFVKFDENNKIVKNFPINDFTFEWGKYFDDNKLKELKSDNSGLPELAKIASSIVENYDSYENGKKFDKSLNSIYLPIEFSFPAYLQRLLCSFDLTIQREFEFNKK